MAVQTGHFLRGKALNPSDAITFYGQEKSSSTVNLARMNFAVHGIEASVKEGNTYYEDHHGLVGRCSYVMANPPFNADAINPDKVKNDERLFTEKKIPGISTKTRMIGNGNYLWAQYFYSYLNETGRAGFVMASSASDAGHGEREIRKELIATDAVDVMVAIGTNFFFTRTLPCTLWFYDKGKPEGRRDKTLMIDARSIFTPISRKINEFSDEQLANITAITWLYRGEDERYTQLVSTYLTELYKQIGVLPDKVNGLDAPTTALHSILDAACVILGEKDDIDHDGVDDLKKRLDEWKTGFDVWKGERITILSDLAEIKLAFDDMQPADNEAQKESRTTFYPFVARLKTFQKGVREQVKQLDGLLKVAKKLDAHKLDLWNRTTVRQKKQEIENARNESVEEIKRTVYWHRQVEWLQSRFPDGMHTDVLGLCKVVDREMIEANDASLSPGRYVGVKPRQYEDDEVFEKRMTQIHTELIVLNEKAQELDQSVLDNFEEFLL